MGAWHSYTKPGYSVVEDQTLAGPPPPPPQKPSGFMRVGGGRSHFDTPYAIQSDSRASLDRPSMPLNHTITSPDLDYDPPPPPPPKPGVSSSNMNTPSVGTSQHYGNNPPWSSSGPPPPTIGRAAGRQNLPHGAMLPAHFRVQSQSAIVVHPGLTDPSSGPSGSNGSWNGTGASNIPGSSTSPMRAPPIRHASEDAPFDSDAPKKKPWFRALRNKGHSDSGVDEEAGPSDGTSSGNAPGKAFVVVRKNQGQGQTYNRRPPASGSSGDGAGQEKGSFVVLRGRDA